MNLNLNYSQTTGVYTLDNGVVIVPPGNAWSGNDNNPEHNPRFLPDGSRNPNNQPGKNNPLTQDIHCVGPAAQGLWRYLEWAFTPDDVRRLGYPAHLGLGICKMLQIGGETFGRDDIFTHGPASDPKLYGQESLGCFVVVHNYRLEQIAARKPDTLTVRA